MRQYWVAPGMRADEGVYITFPLADILRIIALESRRNSCVVIGEDLGTVPEGFGEIMASAGLLSYKVLFLSAGNQDFLCVLSFTLLNLWLLYQPTIYPH